MSNELIERFSNHWRELSENLNLDAQKSDKVLDYLLIQYVDMSRHYHDVRHIVSMLDGAVNIKDKFEDLNAVLLGIFFHDVIYDASKGDNEEQSAIVMRNILDGFIDEDILIKAEDSVVATKAHKETENKDTNLLIDLDMAILGQPWAVYEQYAVGVMKEYVPVYGEEAYRAGRPARFLEPTIAAGNIFITEEFAHLTEQAVKNMQREIEVLKSGKSFAGQALAA